MLKLLIFVLGIAQGFAGESPQEELVLLSRTPVAVGQPTRYNVEATVAVDTEAVSGRLTAVQRYGLRGAQEIEPLAIANEKLTFIVYEVDGLKFTFAKYTCEATFVFHNEGKWEVYFDAVGNKNSKGVVPAYVNKTVEIR